MGRPIKNNADYFSHDADMRNDPKIKALRRKFGLGGYAIWCMILEYLTDQEHFRFQVSDINIELMSGDFDVEPAHIKEVMEYCFIVGLLQIENEMVMSSRLVERLQPVLSKRERRKTTSETTQRGSNGEFRPQKPAETPQSKVKESKVKHILCGVFGKSYLEPKERMPGDVPFYRDIDEQYELLQKHFGDDDKIEAQAKAYLKYCADTKQKRIGHAYKLTETILRSDWVTLTTDPESAVKTKLDPYSEARHNRTLLSLEAWETKYNWKLSTDGEFRKEFGYEQLREGGTVGSNAQSRKSA